MDTDVYLGVDLLEALIKELKKKNFDYVCLSTDPGINSEGLPAALFVKAVNSSNPGRVCNFAAVETEEDARAFFLD